MPNTTGYIPAPATRPTDPGLASPIFRNGNPAQLIAGAALKATQAGHQGAYSPAPFGVGTFAHVRELASSSEAER